MTSSIPRVRTQTNELRGGIKKRVKWRARKQIGGDSLMWNQIWSLRFVFFLFCWKTQEWTSGPLNLPVASFLHRCRLCQRFYSFFIHPLVARMTCPSFSLSLHQHRNLFHLLRSDEDIKRGMDGGSEPARTAAGIYFLILQYSPPLPPTSTPNPPTTTPTYSLYMEPITEYTRPPLLSLAFTALGWRNICICRESSNRAREREIERELEKEREGGEVENTVFCIFVFFHAGGDAFFPWNVRWAGDDVKNHHQLSNVSFLSKRLNRL